MATRVMIIQRSTDQVCNLQSDLTDLGYQVVAISNHYGALEQQVTKYKPEVILVIDDSPDQTALTALHQLSLHQPKPMVMFSSNNNSELINQATRAGVNAYIVDGMQYHRLRPIIEAAIARFNELQSLREQLTETRTKLADRKIIDRAKGILMTNKGISEDQAYTLLRKMAMDKGQKLPEVAQKVIDASELLQ